VTPALAAVVLLAGYAGEAEARRKARGGGGYNPPYASIVVDVKTGKVLQATNADAERHPASITKVMTLYMLFEQMERGRFKLDSRLKISAHAARQAPSKLGLDPGDTISVEDAIKAVVTKSANDIAAAIAENVGGSEERFAEMMTERARSIGMSRTNFENASGLPNPRQVTTARDLAVLGRAIQDRFPRYYPYFGTRSFNFDGTAYRNHNRLLGNVEGVDGIKTGYTRASGFNLLTSAKSDGRHVITVVLGGKSGRLRDQQVAALVETHLPRAYAGARQTPRVIEVAARAPERDDDDEQAPAVRGRAVGLMANVPVPQARPRPAVITEDASARSQVAIAPSPRIGQPMALVASRTTTTARPGSAPLALAATTTPASPAMRWVVGRQPVAQGEGRLVPPGSVKYTNTASATVAADEAQPLPVAAPKLVATPAAESQKARTGWVIQLGATDDEEKARGLLSKARSANPKALADADPFTEKVQKGDSTLFRARFGGFDSGEAEATCKALKRSGFSCFAQKI